MKPHKTIAISLAFSALILGPLSLQAAKVMNRTIATVNGEAILLSEYEKNWNAFIDQQRNMMPPEKMTPEWENDTKKKLLDQMIDDKILLQEAKKRKVKATQRDLENGVIQVKSRFLPEDGRRDLESIVQRMMAGKPADGENSQVDLSAAWKELQGKNPAAIKAADAKFQQELTKEQLTEKQFQDRIRDQLSVVQLTSQEVRQRTKEPTEDQVKNLFDRLQQVMAGKDVKADSESLLDLQSMAKYYAAQSSERVRARHILIRVDPGASFKDKSAARRKLEDVRARIVKGADFAKEAEKNSDDKGSAVQGGDLGFFTKGQMVPSFEKSAFALPVGKVSDIVETDFGYHIIKVEEKNPGEPITLDKTKDDLKEYLYRVQGQNNFEDFVKELRKSASIKVEMDPSKPGK